MQRDFSPWSPLRLYSSFTIPHSGLVSNRRRACFPISFSRILKPSSVWLHEVLVASSAVAFLVSHFIRPSVHIGHSSPTISWLQSQDHKPLLLACHTSLVEQASSYSSCSLSVHQHPALLHRHTLILDHLLTFLMAFSTLVLKLTFSQSLSLHSRLPLPQADFLEFWPLVVWQSLAAVVLVSTAFSAHYNIVILTYLCVVR